MMNMNEDEIIEEEQEEKKDLKLEKLPADRDIHHPVQGRPLPEIVDHIEQMEHRHWREINGLANTSLSSLAATILSQNHKVLEIKKEFDKDMSKQTIIENIEAFRDEPIYKYFHMLKTMKDLNHDITAALFWIQNIQLVVKDKHTEALELSGGNLDKISELKAKKELVEANIVELKTRSETKMAQFEKTVEDMKERAARILMKEELEEIVANGFKKAVAEGKGPKKTGGKEGGTGVYQFECPECGNTYGSAGSLDGHIRALHKNPKAKQ